MIKTDLTFESLAAGCRNELTAAAYHLCGDRDVAQDIVQETLVDAYRGFGGLREPEKAKGWLYAILRRKAINHRKSRKPEAQLHDDIQAPDSDSTETLVRGIIIGQITKLAEQDREALAGKYLLGLSYSELAESLGVKESAVRVRCFRAKERLRETLKSNGVNVPGKRGKAEGDKNGM
ncbi:MAG: RNA polymerase sigma factor [Armatimonadetes bacterium]|nr:RNA polymerase sigma factor [Armatimonadota bacterium]